MSPPPHLDPPLIPLPGMSRARLRSLQPALSLHDRGGGGEWASPSQFPSNPGRLVYSPDGVPWPPRAGGASRGTRQARDTGPMPGTGQQAGEGQDASSSQKVTSISCRRGRSELRFVVTGCGVNPGLPVLALSHCGLLPRDGDMQDHWVSKPRIQPQSCSGLRPVYPREAGAIPGDLLSLPTVLTLTSSLPYWGGTLSLPYWGGKRGWEWAQWGGLGRDGV